RGPELRAPTGSQEGTPKDKQPPRERSLTLQSSFYARPGSASKEQQRPPGSPTQIGGRRKKRRLQIRARSGQPQNQAGSLQAFYVAKYYIERRRETRRILLPRPTKKRGA